MGNEKNILPRIYTIHDVDGIIDLWKEIMGEFVSGEDSFLSAFQEIIDPDTAPLDFVEIMLAQLGNPFKQVVLTDTQKRKLVKYLIPIYRQIGIDYGIVNATRFLTGLEVQIADPHANSEDGWDVGVSEIGESTYVGGDPVYCNMLNWTEDFTQSDWVKTSLSVTPSSETAPSPWSGTVDSLDFSSAGATIEQTVTPLEIAAQSFTFSVWLKASAATTITARVESDSAPSTDYASENWSVTTSWQRFDITHTMLGGASGDVTVKLSSAAGVPETVYAWGAQLVRDDEISPYVSRDADGEDCSEPGKWIYHFFILTDVVLTDEQRSVIEIVADYIKPQHTHYTIIDASSDYYIDHWEVGISEVGETTYVHPAP